MCGIGGECAALLCAKDGVAAPAPSSPSRHSPGEGRLAGQRGSGFRTHYPRRKSNFMRSLLRIVADFEPRVICLT